MLSKSPLRESTPLIGRTSRRILEMVEHGQFHPSHPLPSRRALAERLGVSHSTVSKAMEILREQGVVESQEGSYTFLRTADSLTEALDSPQVEKARVALWFNPAQNFRQIRRGIVRRRFQNQMTRSVPGIEFDTTEFDLDFGSFRLRLFRAFLTGDQPTLGEFPQTYLESLRAYDALGELTAPGSAEYLDLLDDRYLEHAFQGGRLQFLPFACSYSYLVCNKRLLREAGIDPSKDFTSWEDFADVCEQLKAACGVEPVHVSESGLFWLLLHWIYQAGGLPAVGGRLPLPDWQGPAAHKAMDFLLEMVVRRGLIRVTSVDTLGNTPQFLSGKAPIVLEEIMLPTALELGEAEQIVLKPLPPGPTGEGLSLMNTVGWAVNAMAAPAVRRNAGTYAFSWEQWLHTGEGTSTMRRMGVAPALNSLFKDPTRDRSLSEKIPDDWKKTFHQLRECGRWEASDSDLVRNSLAPILRRALKDPAVNTSTLLKHLLLAQYSVGVPN